MFRCSGLLAVVSILVLLLSTKLPGGEIYGTITNDRGEPAAQELITVICDEDTTFAFSDEYGMYSVYVMHAGECTLETGPKPDRYSIISSEYPIRFDVSIEE